MGIAVTSPPELSHDAEAGGLESEAWRQADFDAPWFEEHYIERRGADALTRLRVEGIRCGGCAAKIERLLAVRNGVRSATVAMQDRELSLRWAPDEVRLSEVVAELVAAGFGVAPAPRSGRTLAIESESRDLLKRIGVAAACGMQVMMISIGLYFAEPGAIALEMRDFLRWVAMLLTLPVLLYSAAPFFQAAWRGIRARHLGMDAPVALAIGGAFLGSTWACVIGKGEIYFDSVCMFTLFLSAGRYLEVRGRVRAARVADQIGRGVPETALRIDADGTQQVVAIRDLEPGNQVLIPVGSMVPADGTVLDGTSSLDESLLTGESEALRRAAGDSVLAGSRNLEEPLLMQVDRVGNESVFGTIAFLRDQSLSARPILARLADRVAPGFIAGVLTLAGLTGLCWFLAGDPGWFEHMLAVLVVSCPCALSLASPAAASAAGAALHHRGILVPGRGALEALPRADTWIFDKTGTLTAGRLELSEVVLFTPASMAGLPEDRALAVCRALEVGSMHPIAIALAGDDGNGATVTDRKTHPGRGVSGTVDNTRYVLGNLRLVAEEFSGIDLHAAQERLDSIHTPAVVLASETGVLALLRFEDELADGAVEAIRDLHHAAREVKVLSGDRAVAVDAQCNRLDVDEKAGGLDPQAKWSRIQQLQQGGHRVVFIGDGVNDAPAMGQADVAIAMGRGTDLARTTADIVMMHDRLGDLAWIRRHARRYGAVVRQNFAWAIGYNLTAVPLAVCGLLPPWLAALGMSFSSVVVVANSLRLNSVRTAAQTTAEAR